MFQSHITSFIFGVSLGLVFLVLFLWLMHTYVVDKTLRIDQRMHLSIAGVQARIEELDAELQQKVDPWEMQSKLMRISGQDQPGKPMLTDGALLYAALIMEESAETFEGLLQPLAKHMGPHIVGDPLLNLDKPHLYSAEIRLAAILAGAHRYLDVASRQMRQVLAEKPGIKIDLDVETALPIFDGTTDLAVVNSGFALAMGFPGAEGYRDVAGSNLSKANPVTKIIDKDPSGKWIKGSAYQEPNLAKILQRAEFDAIF